MNGGSPGPGERPAGRAGEPPEGRTGERERDDATGEVGAREAVMAPVVAPDDARGDDAARAPVGEGDHSGWGTQARMFCAIGAFMALIGAVYWFMSYEWAGTVLLGLTASMALGTGLYLGWPRRGRGGLDPQGGPPLEPGHDPHDGVWFPEASIWPLAIGAGMVLVGNGLLLGRWLLIPAGVFLAWSIAGMIRQGRRRA